MIKHPAISGIERVMNQLMKLLRSVDEAEYVLPLGVLSGSTMGQHTRHILDMYLVLTEGYDSGDINYDQRARELETEKNTQYAMNIIEQVIQGIDKPEKELHLTCLNPAGVFTVNSSYYRELQYCLEHTIHHMAQMKAGLQEFPEIDIPKELGIAFSTIAYRNSSN